MSNFSIGSEALVDISPDGRRVLVREIWDGSDTGLILWDSRTPSSHQQFSANADGQVIAGDQVIRGGAFILGDDEHLLLLNKEGIVRYNLHTRQTEVLNSAVNSNWAWVYFSPNNEYAAVIARTCNLFIIPVHGDALLKPKYAGYRCKSYG